jgi:hypothetical protein
MPVLKGDCGCSLLRIDGVEQRVLEHPADVVRMLDK